jgi:hypothetical protein
VVGESSQPFTGGGGPTELPNHWWASSCTRSSSGMLRPSVTIVWVSMPVSGWMVKTPTLANGYRQY